MRLHSDTLTADLIRSTLLREKVLERIAPSVQFKRLTEHGSRTHKRGIEVQLESTSKVEGDGRRFGNSGAYSWGDNYSATYDEWGYLLSALYELDREMIVGSPANAVYEDRGDFHHKTGLSYSPVRLNLAAARNDGHDPYPFVIGGQSGTVGRRGAGRSDGDRLHSTDYRDAVNNPGKSIHGYLRYSPRPITPNP